MGFIEKTEKKSMTWKVGAQRKYLLYSQKNVRIRETLRLRSDLEECQMTEIETKKKIFPRVLSITWGRNVCFKFSKATV
jgi:hypothetical protein